MSYNREGDVGKAELIGKFQDITKNGLCIRGIIWHISGDPNYSRGIKYRLVVFEIYTNEVLLLFDNHFPRGDHYHFLGEIKHYEFVDVDFLLKDFFYQLSEIERIYENKKNNN